MIRYARLDFRCDFLRNKMKKYSEQKRFNPETCCIFDLDGKRINLNTISVINRLNELLIYFNTFRLSAIDLGLSSDLYKVNNFSININNNSYYWNSNRN